MTHIICRAMTCFFWDEGVCAAEEIEYEPDVGCLTFQDLSEMELASEDDEDIDWDEDDDENLLADDDDWDDDDWDEEIDL